MAKQGFRVIDSDLHVIEPRNLWEDYLDPKFRGRIVTVPGDSGPVRAHVDGKVLPPFADRPERQRAWSFRYKRPGAERLHRGTLPKEALEAMDIEGIDIGILFRTWATQAINIDGLEPAFAAAMCRAWNRWIADFCQESPERLKPSALVPLQDIDLAVAEARFGVRELGAITLVLPSHLVNSRPLYDRYFDPLWAAAQEMNVAVSFHGNHAVYAEHLAKRYLDNLVLSHACGQPVEMMLTLGAIVTGGVLSRFPRMRMAFLEGNCGWLPWWLWALDERWEAWGDRELFGQDAKPSELFQRQCFISAEPEEELVKYVVAELGDNTLVLSTDWPHDDSRYPHAIDSFLGEVPLSSDSKRKILWDNTARLYNL
ncbi:MAG TPA: amidohydrolase family protein [Methylomirabilota bacterium]|jgi:predicted TIM-barrel fold metal-dependent hydrolase